ncbi:MAG TPA: STAS domain-containing protein [Gammaproteobacteria bacterium]|nr:STAS domain-containing protein [Gammaproteobacteria bacterium]
MVRKKKSMIGFDPLAWLGDENESPPDSNKASNDAASNDAASNDVASNATERKNKSPVRKKADSKKMISVLGHSIDETALLKGYKLISDDLNNDDLNNAVESFYEELFLVRPDIKPLFKDVTLSSQANKIATAIKVLIDNLYDEKALKTILSSTDISHRRYGVLSEHYPVVVDILVNSFKNKAGRSWTKAVSKSWIELLTGATEIMGTAGKKLNADTEVVDEPFSEIDPMAVEESVAEDNKLPVLELNVVQDISKSQALKNDILSLVNDNDEIDIDASEVERVDGSALQLLCALFIYAQNNNLIIHWIKPSNSFMQSVKISGMQKILELG